MGKIPFRFRSLVFLCSPTPRKCLLCRLLVGRSVSKAPQWKLLQYQAQKYDRKLLVPLIMGEKSFKPRPQNRIFFQNFRRAPLSLYKIIWEFAPPRGGEVWLALPNESCRILSFYKIIWEFTPPRGGGGFG